jgi:hypothetical protein
MVAHPMSFKGNEIQVKQYLCNPELIISYNETMLDEVEVVWIGLLTTTKAPNINELKEVVPEEYHKFMKLFGEPLAQKLPSQRTFDHQIQIKEG